MPVIRRADVQADESNPNVRRLPFISTPIAAAYLEMAEFAFVAGKKARPHIHPTHEEVLYVIEGPLNYILGDEVGVLNAGDLLLAPTGVKHGITNPGSEPRRVMVIYPTRDVQRVFL